MVGARVARTRRDVRSLGRRTVRSRNAPRRRTRRSARRVFASQPKPRRRFPSESERTLARISTGKMRRFPPSRSFGSVRLARRLLRGARATSLCSPPLARRLFQRRRRLVAIQTENVFRNRNRFFNADLRTRTSRRNLAFRPRTSTSRVAPLRRGARLGRPIRRRRSGSLVKRSLRRTGGFGPQPVLPLSIHVRAFSKTPQLDLSQPFKRQTFRDALVPTLSRKLQ